jgi:hypothetical protein
MRSWKRKIATLNHDTSQLLIFLPCSDETAGALMLPGQYCGCHIAKSPIAKRDEMRVAGNEDAGFR